MILPPIAPLRPGAAAAVIIWVLLPVLLARPASTPLMAQPYVNGILRGAATCTLAGAAARLRMAARYRRFLLRPARSPGLRNRLQCRRGADRLDIVQVTGNAPPFDWRQSRRLLGA